MHIPVAPCLVLLILSLPSQAQVPVRASVGGACEQSNTTLFFYDFSGNGGFVAFSSASSALVPGDVNPGSDIFVRDLAAGTLEIVSVDSSGMQGSGNSETPRLSADGRFVAFMTGASLVPADTNVAGDIYIRDRLLGTTERVSVGPGGVQTPPGVQYSRNPSISADGRFVAFESSATNLVAGDTNDTPDVFVHDRLNGVTMRISVSSTGAQGNSQSSLSSISADGRFIAFDSFASNLATNDMNTRWDVFVRDRDPDVNGVFDEGNSVTELVSVAPVGAANENSRSPSITDDGRYVAFWSEVDLAAPDFNGAMDVYVRDRLLGTTTLVSQSTAGEPGLLGSGEAEISGDGGSVAFLSFAQNLVPDDLNGYRDVFVRDLAAATTRRVSLNAAGEEANNFSASPTISDDGTIVAFRSGAGNLVRNDTNGTWDVFVVPIDLPPSPVTSSCAGDGSGASCPCGNSGAIGRGCASSAGPGAELRAQGTAQPDELVLYTLGQPANSFSIVLQGNALIGAVTFGDGLRCVGGALRRIAQTNAIGGGVVYPGCGEASISARSAALGDPIAPGTQRHYLVYYRDSNLAFCPEPAGNSWNATQTLSVDW